MAGLATATGIVLKIVTSNRVYASSLFDGSAGTITDYTCMNSVLADMDAADTATITVGVYGISGDTADISGAADGRTQFSGFLAC